jgi:hypothetical protein
MSQNNFKFVVSKIFILKAFKEENLEWQGQTKNPQAKYRLRCFGIMGGHDLFF